MHVARAAAVVLAALLALAGCEDPARPIPDVGGGSLPVDSDPQGGRIIVDGNDTGEITPALVANLTGGARTLVVELDTSLWTYRYTDAFVLDHDADTALGGPLTIRCASARCLLEAAEFHSAGNVRWVVNGAGPQFVYQGTDVGVVWPVSTSNSYVSLGMATMTATVGGTPVALGLRNVGSSLNYWAGRPIPELLGFDPHRVSVPAWIVPPNPTSATQIRGLEVIQRITVDAARPDVILVNARWRNISADSAYRVLDPATPPGGVTYGGAYLGFILNADVGPFAEAGDDLASYSADRSLVFAYDGDFEVAGFSGGYADEPALVGLMLLDAPGDVVRLNAWPASADFGAGVDDADGRLLLLADQSQPSNHEDARIGFAPDDEVDDYILSVAGGPFVLAPGDTVSATFALLLAPPAAGSYDSGVLMPAGDPADAGRPLAATAARLLELADSVIGVPPAAPRSR